MYDIICDHERTRIPVITHLSLMSTVKYVNCRGNVAGSPEAFSTCRLLKVMLLVFMLLAFMLLKASLRSR